MSRSFRVQIGFVILIAWTVLILISIRQRAVSAICKVQMSAYGRPI